MFQITSGEIKDFFTAAALIGAFAGAIWLAIKKAVLPVEREVVKPVDPDATQVTGGIQPMWQKFERVYEAIRDLHKTIVNMRSEIEERLSSQDERMLEGDKDRKETLREVAKLKEYVIQLERNYQRERRGSAR